MLPHSGGPTGVYHSRYVAVPKQALRASGRVPVRFGVSLFHLGALRLPCSHGRRPYASNTADVGCTPSVPGR